MSSAARAMRRREQRATVSAGEGWQLDNEWQADVRVMAWSRTGGDAPMCWRKGLLSAIVSRDHLQGDAVARWHVSVSHRDRVPSWEEMAEAAHELRPGVPMAIGVPPRSWWINVHPHVLHLWELRDTALVEQWRGERRGDRPS